MASPRATSARGVPLAMAVPAVIAVVFLLVPLVAVVVRAPWGRIVELLTTPESMAALRLSLVCATLATFLSLVLGVPLAYVLARSRSRARPLLRALVVVPLVMPPVVGGIALLLAFGRRGLVGGPVYDAFGISVPFTTTAVVLAEAFVAMPFLVITVEAALRTADPRLEEAAATLGASRMEVLRRVTLPLVAPSVLAGSVLCWARALGEFGATITFAGSASGTTRTLPLEVYLSLEADPEAAYALSLLLLGVCVLVLVLLRDRWFLPGLRQAAR
jgi:molybdate transport system permease protein